MSVREPNAQPDFERPIDLTDLPDRAERPRPARVPEHHPDDSGLPGDVPGPSGPDSPPRE
ncbi:hypothetical protein [Paractinoplanes brasiliensis]|uniref:Uncharacterized protein n=1 Tax=Paractinoplanes brasiliensis TaxID=52695 RepID=A0A4V3C676_9ACTN|nr:hypothetical protein [Actinoplanes brasiliensis]TDO32668.1 hypothetical protein C8E87_8138 [Actinoplanes brasiliensis]GID32801.1 hypothetical protein Abr02nite_77840 [Actinoplanes brasiliensis]